MGKAFHTIPSYAWSDWTVPAALNIPVQVAAMGGDGLMLQQQFLVTSQTSTTPTTGSHTIPAAGLKAMAQAAVTAGLLIGYKPHVATSTNSPNQTTLIPGGFYTNSAYFTAGQPITVTGHGLDSSWIGAKIANPNAGHLNDAPLSLSMDAYGTTAPTYATVTGFPDANSISISRSTVTLGSAASVCIAQDSRATGWFTAYRALIDADLAALSSVGITPWIIDISTEHNFSHVMYPALWRSFITGLRTSYPGVKLVCGTAGTTDLFASITFFDLLDALSCTDYPTVQGAAVDATRAQFDAAWATRLAQYQAAQTAWANKGYNLPIWLSEVGCRTRDHAGYNPLSSSGGTYDELTQAMFLDSFMRVADPYLLGWSWWTTEQPNPANVVGSNTVEVGQTTYGIYGKAAASVHRAHKGKRGARAVISGGVRSRITRS